MTSSELGEAIAYDLIDPCGEYRQELRHGQLMQLLDRAHFKREEPTRPVTFMNFIVKQEGEERELSDEELEAYAVQVFGA